jgi:hypothetical protein
VRADLIYTLNGGKRYEEWFRIRAVLAPGCKATAVLPKGTTHYVFNLIDENQFLRSYPELPDMGQLRKTKSTYSAHALDVKAKAEPTRPKGAVRKKT